jgi:adenylylsulfate kinase
MSVAANTSEAPNGSRHGQAAGTGEGTVPRGPGAVLWFTGLSGSGKSTLAEEVAPRLRALGKRVEILDGDVVRTNLSKGLGFSREDRDLNVARIAFVAHLLARNGVFVITASISPFRATRDDARRLIGDFVEIHVAPPLEECIQRDVKGLYRKAIAGEIKDFTGIGDPYEEPPSPELRLDTSRLSVDEAASRVVGTLRDLGYLGAEGADRPKDTP